MGWVRDANVPHTTVPVYIKYVRTDQNVLGPIEKATQNFELHPLIRTIDPFNWDSHDSIRDAQSWGYCLATDYDPVDPTGILGFLSGDGTHLTPNDLEPGAYGILQNYNQDPSRFNSPVQNGTGPHPMPGPQVSNPAGRPFLITGPSTLPDSGFLATSAAPGLAFGTFGRPNVPVSFSSLTRPGAQDTIRITPDLPSWNQALLYTMGIDPATSPLKNLLAELGEGTLWAGIPYFNAYADTGLYGDNPGTPRYSTDADVIPGLLKDMDGAIFNHALTHKDHVYVAPTGYDRTGVAADAIFEENNQHAIKVESVYNRYLDIDPDYEVVTQNMVEPQLPNYYMVEHEFLTYNSSAHPTNPGERTSGYLYPGGNVVSVAGGGPLTAGLGGVVTALSLTDVFTGTSSWYDLALEGYGFSGPRAGFFRTWAYNISHIVTTAGDWEGGIQASDHFKNIAVLLPDLPLLRNRGLTLARDNRGDLDPGNDIFSIDRYPYYNKVTIPLNTTNPFNITGGEVIRGFGESSTPPISLGGGVDVAAESTSLIAAFIAGAKLSGNTDLLYGAFNFFSLLQMTLVNNISTFNLGLGSIAAGQPVFPHYPEGGPRINVTKAYESEKSSSGPSIVRTAADAQVQQLLSIELEQLISCLDETYPRITRPGNETPSNSVRAALGPKALLLLENYLFNAHSNNAVVAGKGFIPLREEWSGHTVLGGVSAKLFEAPAAASALDYLGAVDLVINPFLEFIGERTRRYDQMVGGHNCWSETFMWAVEKRVIPPGQTSASGPPVQTLFFSPDWADDSGSGGVPAGSPIEYIDTQIKYGVRYQYDLIDIRLVLGNNYHYRNLSVYDIYSEVGGQGRALANALGLYDEENMTTRQAEIRAQLQNAYVTSGPGAGATSFPFPPWQPEDQEPTSATSPDHVDPGSLSTYTPGNWERYTELYVEGFYIFDFPPGLTLDNLLGPMNIEDPFGWGSWAEVPWVINVIQDEGAKIEVEWDRLFLEPVGGLGLDGNSTGGMNSAWAAGNFYMAGGALWSDTVAYWASICSTDPPNCPWVEPAPVITCQGIPFPCENGFFPIPCAGSDPTCEDCCDDGSGQLGVDPLDPYGLGSMHPDWLDPGLGYGDPGEVGGPGGSTEFGSGLGDWIENAQPCTAAHFEWFVAQITMNMPVDISLQTGGATTDGCPAGQRYFPRPNQLGPQLVDGIGVYQTASSNMNANANVYFNRAVPWYATLPSGCFNYDDSINGFFGMTPTTLGSTMSSYFIQYALDVYATGQTGDGLDIYVIPWSVDPAGILIGAGVMPQEWDCPGFTYNGWVADSQPTGISI